MKDGDSHAQPDGDQSPRLRLVSARDEGEGCRPQADGVRMPCCGGPIRTVVGVASSHKITFAREQRRDPTRVEEDLWGLVRDAKLGFKIRRQHPLRDFVLDFYCQEAKLCIEIDGPEHRRQQGYDDWRTEQLERRGIEVLRFAEAETRANLAKVAVAIRRRCVERCGR